MVTETIGKVEAKKAYLTAKKQPRRNRATWQLFHRLERLKELIPQFEK
jgi:hypothetical protein